MLAFGESRHLTGVGGLEAAAVAGPEGAVASGYAATCVDSELGVAVAAEVGDCMSRGETAPCL